MKKPKKLKLKCQNCKSEHNITIDEDLIPDTKKVKLLACFNCSDDFKKNKFKEQAERHMDPKHEIVDGEDLIVECKKPKLHKYKEAIPIPI